jgi:hypothetical protein
VAWLTDIIAELDEIATTVKQIEERLAVLVGESGSTLRDEVGVGRVNAAELLVEINDPTRFASESKFARWCGIACVACRRVRMMANRSGTDSTCSETAVLTASCRASLSPSPAADTNPPSSTSTASALKASRNAKHVDLTSDNSPNRIIRRTWVD